MSDPTTSRPDDDVRHVLEAWARATREGRRDDILANHLPEVLIYDVLAPMKYEGAAAYRSSWDAWQPETQGDTVFEFQDLHVTAAEGLAFAHGFIRCGGTTPSGRAFEDVVRATFCLVHRDGSWKVAHQHISRPISVGG